jgi:hypothetical protein
MNGSSTAAGSGQSLAGNVPAWQVGAGVTAQAASMIITSPFSNRTEIADDLPTNRSCGQLAEPDIALIMPDHGGICDWSGPENHRLEIRPRLICFSCRFVVPRHPDATRGRVHAIQILQVPHDPLVAGCVPVNY